MKNKTMITLAATLLTLATAASAASPEEHPAAAACKEDVAKLCPGIAPGEGRIAACMKEHKSQLSRACKRALVKQKRKGRGGDGGDAPAPSSSSQ